MFRTSLIHRSLNVQPTVDPSVPLPEGKRPSIQQVILVLLLIGDCLTTSKCVVICYRCFFPILGQPVLTARSGRGERVFDERHAKRYPPWVCSARITNITADVVAHIHLWWLAFFLFLLSLALPERCWQAGWGPWCSTATAGKACSTVSVSCPDSGLSSFGSAYQKVQR